MGKLGRKHTLEELKKMSEAQKGRIISKEHREKISRARMGYVVPLEVRKKISEGHKGLKFSDEHRKKIGLSNHLYPRVKKHSKITKEKISKKLRGNKHHNWKGGITSSARKIRGSYLYKNWRKLVFIKDNYTCLMCGYQNKNALNLQADHYPETFAFILKKFDIKSLEDAIQCEELWLVKKNRTLCFDCHKTTGTYVGRNKI